jgi:hypothetical protein
MAFAITISMLHCFHHYCIQFLPLEVFAVVIGYKERDKNVATNFVHPRILSATTTSVRADWDDAFRIASQFYTVGFMHTHPGKHSSVAGSEADRAFHQFMGNRFYRQFGRQASFLIYAPHPGIFAVYDEAGPQPHEIMNDTPVALLRPDELLYG